MRVPFDQGTPAPLRRKLAGLTVDTAFEQGWSRLSNGDLLAAAEAGGYSVLVTTDTNLRYQQNLADRRIALVVLTTTSWPRIQRVAEAIAEAILRSSPGSYEEILIP